MIHIGIVYGPLMDFGGVEKRVAALLRNASDHNVKFTIFSKTSNRFLRVCEETDTEVIDWESRNFLDLLNLVKLKQLIIKNGIEVIHVMHPRAYLAGVFIPKNSVATVHLQASDFYVADSLYNRIVRIGYQIVEWLCLRPIFKSVIFVSKSAYSNRNLPNGFFIPNGVKVLPDDNHFQIKDGIIRFVGMGRLTRQKGFDVAISALTQISNHWEFTLIGEGIEEEALKKLANNLEVSDKVTFSGFVNNPVEKLLEYDVYVLPSRFEGVPFSMLEAMSVGLPVIASNVGGVSNIIRNDQNGWLFVNEDVTELKQCLENVINMRASELQSFSLKAKETAKLFSEEKMIKDVNRIYKEIANG